MHKPNHLLEMDIKETLAWDGSIDDRRIEVKADDGHVALQGAVPTYYEKELATEDAWTVGGVRVLDNDLVVGPLGAAITDAEIAAGCATALDHEWLVPKGSVEAVVVDGVVTLRGQVRHHREREAAKFAASRVDGVLDIRDSITISRDPIPSDVADRINNAFKRSAIIDDSLITVTNKDHTIYLDGTVGSYVARRAAENTAWQAPGVSDVVDRTVIAP